MAIAMTSMSRMISEADVGTSDGTRVACSENPMKGIIGSALWLCQRSDSDSAPRIDVYQKLVVDVKCWWRLYPLLDASHDLSSIVATASSSQHGAPIGRLRRAVSAADLAILYQVLCWETTFVAKVDHVGHFSFNTFNHTADLGKLQ